MQQAGRLCPGLEIKLPVGMRRPADRPSGVVKPEGSGRAASRTHRSGMRDWVEISEKRRDP